MRGMPDSRRTLIPKFLSPRIKQRTYLLVQFTPPGPPRLRTLLSRSPFSVLRIGFPLSNTVEVGTPKNPVNDSPKRERKVDVNRSMIPDEPETVLEGHSLRRCHSWESFPHLPLCLLLDFRVLESRDGGGAGGVVSGLVHPTVGE